MADDVKKVAIDVKHHLMQNILKSKYFVLI